jgi:hypothetical protein
LEIKSENLAITQIRFYTSLIYVIEGFLSLINLEDGCKMTATATKELVNVKEISEFLGKAVNHGAILHCSSAVDNRETFKLKTGFIHSFGVVEHGFYAQMMARNGIEHSVSENFRYENMKEVVIRQGIISHTMRITYNDNSYYILEVFM